MSGSGVSGDAWDRMLQLAETAQPDVAAQAAIAAALFEVADALREISTTHDAGIWRLVEVLAESPKGKR